MPYDLASEAAGHQQWLARAKPRTNYNVLMAFEVLELSEFIRFVLLH